MNKEAVKELLRDIERQGLLGVSRTDDDTIETVLYALDKGLLARSETGNFILTEKGLSFLSVAENMKTSTVEKNFPPPYNNAENDRYSQSLVMISAQQKKLRRNVFVAIIFLIILLAVLLIGVHKFA